MGTIGVILAGGLSSRMGQDKALMRIADTCMQDRIYHLLSKTSVKKIVVSRNTENSDYLSDIIPNKGPLSGIHSAAMQFPSDNLLFVPVDLPLLDYSILENLINHGKQTQCNTRYYANQLPLYINSSDLIRQSLDHTLRNSDNFSVGQFCKKFPLQEIKLENKLSLFNTNTPEQWQFASQYFSVNNSANLQEDVYEPLI